MSLSDRPITREQLLISAGVMAGIAVAALDSTVVGTAMPTIIGQLGGIQSYGWVFAAYLLTATTTVPVFSTLADTHGRKPIFLIGLALFVGGSALCGLSQSMLQLIVFRAIQGLGAGAVQPIAFTINGDIFEPRQRARMQGLISSVCGISAIIGPAIGGLITATVGWRWVFYLNVPVGIFAASLIAVVLHEHVERREHRLNWLGSVTLTLGVALLLVAPSTGIQLGWTSPVVIGSLVGAAVLLVIFARSEAAAPEPLISRELLRRRIVAAGLAIGTLAGVVMYGLTAYVPPLIQGVMGGSPLDAGLVVGAMSVGWPVGSIISGRTMLRAGVRPIVLLGAALLLAGSLMLLEAGNIRSLWYIAAATGVTGLGMGLITTPTLVAIQTTVSWRQRGQATGLVQFSRTIGGSIGTGLLGALLATAVGPLASAILDPVARTSIPHAALAAARDQVLGGLEWIYMILAVAALGVLVLAVRLMPAVRIGDAGPEAPVQAGSPIPAGAAPGPMGRRTSSGAGETPPTLGEP
jgi:EmrB/QacA subfamily drug resistance transporter